MDDLETLLRQTLQAKTTPPASSEVEELTRRVLLARRHPLPGQVKIAVAAAVVFAFCLWYVNGGDSTLQRWIPVPAEHRSGQVAYTAPSDWYVTTDPSAADRRYAPFSMELGDFLSTVPVGQTCSRTQDSNATVTTCDTANAVLTIPQDGAIAWISTGHRPTTDEGPDPAAVRICSGSPDRHLYHATRTIGPPGSLTRVVIDGCLYGPKYRDYQTLLNKTLDSVKIVPR